VEVEPGSHVVLVRTPGHADWWQRVVVPAGEAVSVTVTPSAVAGLPVVRGGPTASSAPVDDAVPTRVPAVERQDFAGDGFALIGQPGEDG